jgi:hypothetical protein
VITSITPTASGDVLSAHGAICSYCLRVIERDPAIATTSSVYYLHYAEAIAMAEPRPRVASTTR